jgi:hypothetical protein
VLVRLMLCDVLVRLMLCVIKLGLEVKESRTSPRSGLGRNNWGGALRDAGARELDE